MKICHLTSAHPRFDTRIFVKQCCSLAQLYDTYLVVADGDGNEVRDKVNIVDVGKFNGRKNRILYAPKVVFEKALALDADIYHLHDPELIPIGLKLKKLGKKVIFDAHEDLPNQIQSKHYLNPIMKKIVSSKEMQQIDNYTINEIGIPSMVLMERAALSVVEKICENIDIRNKKILIVCGTGNNGGDGLAIARILYGKKASIQTIIVGSEKFMLLL